MLLTFILIQPTLWSKVFKNELEMGHNSEAYKALMGNPDTARLVALSGCVSICLVITEGSRLPGYCIVSLDFQLLVFQISKADLTQI